MILNYYYPQILRLHDPYHLHMRTLTGPFCNSISYLLPICVYNQFTTISIKKCVWYII